MASITMADTASRAEPMAKKNWVKKAIPKAHRGKFREKAEAAGMSTAAYAEKEKGASGTLGKEARLAQTLMGMSHKKKHKSVLYDHSEKG